MNSPLSDTVSPGVYLAFWWWQAGREAGSTSTGTSSHWQQRETRLEVLELPFSWPPFPLFLATLRSLPHFSPSTSRATSHRRRRQAVEALCATKGHHFTPMKRPFWHTDPILLTSRPITVPPHFPTIPLFFFGQVFFFFSKQAFHLVSRDRYRAGIDLWFTIPFPFEEMALGSR